MEVHLEELDPERDDAGAGVDAHHGIPTHAQQSREEDGHLATASRWVSSRDHLGKILDAPTGAAKEKKIYLFPY